MSFEPHRLTDPRHMRALAHPVRLSLMEALGQHGELTATEAAQHVGQSPSSCSFHLRQLAKYGFVEETGTGTGRRRPWRLTRIGLVVDDAPAADPEAQAAGVALAQVMTARYLERARERLAARSAQPEPWRHLTGTDQFLLHVTPAELEQLNADVLKLMTAYLDRFRDPALRPPDARAIEALVLTYPMD
jgi:DNA-binding transcriptional ArsR family regulator